MDSIVRVVWPYYRLNPDHLDIEALLAGPDITLSNQSIQR